MNFVGYHPKSYRQHLRTDTTQAPTGQTRGVDVIHQAAFKRQQAAEQAVMAEALESGEFDAMTDEEWCRLVTERTGYRLRDGYERRKR